MSSTMSSFFTTYHKEVLSHISNPSFSWAIRGHKGLSRVPPVFAIVTCRAIGAEFSNLANLFSDCAYPRSSFSATK